MPDNALVNIIGPDRVGLVAAVSGCLFDLGCNLVDTTFSVLGGGAEFTAVCELPDGLALDTVDGELRSLPETADSKVAVSPFSLATSHGPSGEITHRIEVTGGDRPGLIARLSEVFVEYGANIVRLNARKSADALGQDLYEVAISVWIPPERAQSCLATVANTAGELGLNYLSHEVPDQP